MSESTICTSISLCFQYRMPLLYYISDIFDKSDSSLDDEYYEKALKLIVETESASATFLQRRLGIGYKRAQNLIDLLEANGVIGPAIGASPRKVFLKK